MKTLVIALLCISSFALHAQGVTTTTYYNLRYEQVPTKPDEGFIAIITTPDSEKEHWADIKVTTADGILLQQYSYLNLDKGLRRDSIVYNRPDGTKVRRSYFDASGTLIREYAYDSLEQMTSSYEYEVNYLYSYEDGALESKTHVVNDKLTDSIYYYYPTGKLRLIETFSSFGDYKSKISYHENGEVIYQSTFDENGNETVLIGEKPAEEAPAAKEGIQEFTEKMPEFPGGVSGLYAYISGHIQYPRAARDNGVEGTVYMKFVVTEDGAVIKAESLRPIFPPMEFEALRVIMNSPKWTPGMMDGKNVAVWYRLPVKFTLED